MFVKSLIYVCGRAVYVVYVSEGNAGKNGEEITSSIDLYRVGFNF